MPHQRSRIRERLVELADELDRGGDVWERYTHELSQLPASEQRVWTEIGTCSELLGTTPNLVFDMDEENLTLIEKRLGVFGVWPWIPHSRAKQLKEGADLYDAYSDQLVVEAWYSGEQSKLLIKNIGSLKSIGTAILISTQFSPESLAMTLPKEWFRFAGPKPGMHTIITGLLEHLSELRWCCRQISSNPARLLILASKELKPSVDKLRSEMIDGGRRVSWIASDGQGPYWVEPH